MLRVIIGMALSDRPLSGGSEDAMGARRRDENASGIGSGGGTLALGLALIVLSGGLAFSSSPREDSKKAASVKTRIPAAPTETPWRWEKTDGASAALYGPAGLVWRFRYDPTLDVPYFHPLNTVEGRTLTADRPADHLWHHGLWFSWKYINRVNYWEIDGKTGRPEGKTSWRDVEVETRDNGTATIAMELDYRPAAEETPVLTEKRTLEVSAPDAEGTYTVDWTGRFKAVGEVVLDRTPLPGEPGGQVFGGYAGFSVRLAKALEDRELVTSDGPVLEMKDDRYRGRHIAAGYSGLIDGRVAGIAVCDHPGNPRTPTPWYMIKSADMSFFTPAPLCYEPLKLKAGDYLVLRYRVLVHSGRWDAERLRREAGRFSRKESDPR